MRIYSMRRMGAIVQVLISSFVTINTYILYPHHIVRLIPIQLLRTDNKKMTILLTQIPQKEVMIFNNK